MDLRLTGKQAIVCGGSQGIGKAIAIELAALGANVTLVARHEETLKNAIDELPREDGQVHDYLIASFFEPEKVRQTAEEYVQKRKKAHILINNTGGPTPGTAMEATGEEFMQAFSAHVLCNHYWVQAVVPFMRADRYGRIINIISTSVKAPIPGLGVSNTIRGAVASWAKTLARELAPDGITVNNVLPGMTLTKRLDALLANRAKSRNMDEQEYIKLAKEEVPIKRFADPSEIASVVAFLASPAASYVTGINLPVDGGSLPSL